MAGMVLFLRVASALWVQPSERGTPGGPGDALYWFLFVVPILVAFFLLNISALLAILLRTPKPERRVVLAVWLVIVALWVGVVVVDHHLSFRSIDAQYGKRLEPRCNHARAI